MQRNPEVEAPVIEMLEAMSTGDADGATAGLSEDLTTAIGTDAEEWWEGYDVSAKAFRAQLEASGGLPFEMTDVRGYELEGWVGSRPAGASPSRVRLPPRPDDRGAPPRARSLESAPGARLGRHPERRPGHGGAADLRVA